MQHLLDWIVDEKRTYSEGLKLFEQLSSNRNLVRLFSNNETPKNRDWLYEELKKIAKLKGLTIPTTDIVRVFKKGTAIPEMVIASYEENPEPIIVQDIPASVVELPEQAELTKRHAYLFRQKEILRLSLHNFPKNNQAEIVSARKLVMQEILAFKKEIGEIVEKKRFFEKYGYYPQEYKETKDDIIRMLENARSNVSRQRRLISTAKTIDDKEKAEIALAKYEKIRDNMLKKLGSL